MAAYELSSRFKSYGDQLWDIRGPNWLQQDAVYDKFLVDVRNHEGFFFRAYVVDVIDGGVLVNWDCTDSAKPRFVSFEDVREVSPESPMLKDIQGPIEVLVSVRQNGPEFWFPGRIQDMVHFEGSLTDPEWGLAKVVITLDDGGTIQLVINDGPYQACRRIREPKEAPAVTPKTFQKVGYSWPEPSIPCPDPKGEFPQVHSCRSFAYWWLKRTKTMFVAVTDDWVIILNRGDPKETTGWDVQDGILVKLYPVKYAPFGYLDWFRDALLSGTTGIIHDITQNVIECVVFTEQNTLECNIIFENIHQDLQLLVLSYVNVYDRAGLQRVSQCWKQLLSSRFVQRDLIISCLPSKWTLTRHSQHYLPTRRRIPDIISILCHSLTKETITVYLVGNWFLFNQPCLHSFIACLKFLSIKLDWIVLVDNDHFTPQAFIQFQTMGKYVNRTSQQIPDFASVCIHLAIQNSKFMISTSKFVPFNLFPASENRSTLKSLEIRVARWSFCFGTDESDRLALSLIDIKAELAVPEVL